MIAGILPDLLVKGGDYKPEEIAGSKKSGPTAAKSAGAQLRRRLLDH
ncbi:hypothetical protein ACVXG8_17305 [Escherichia coli]